MPGFPVLFCRSLVLGLGFGLMAVCLWLGATNSVFAETYTIQMGTANGNLVFEPATLTVKPGDVVQWQNNTLPPHNVIFDGHNVPPETLDLVGALSHSKLMLKPDETYELEITEALAPGEYTYFCAPHRRAGMVGKLVIAG